MKSNVSIFLWKLYSYTNRSWLFLHMAEEHGFNVGQPDNIGNPFTNILSRG